MKCGFRSGVFFRNIVRYGFVFFCGKQRKRNKKEHNKYKREKAVCTCESGGANLKEMDGAVKVKFIGYVCLVFVRIPPIWNSI